MLASRSRAGFLIVVLAANLVFFGGLDIRDAHACSCGSVSPEKQLESSDAVFTGEVTGIDEEDQLAPEVGPPLGRVTFDVNESWKGVPEGPVVAYGQGPGASCGLNFDKGKSYLVYAYRTGDGSDDHLETGLCTATKPLAEAQADLRSLGPPTDTLPDTGGPEPAHFVGSRTGSAVAVSALLMLAGAVFLRRKLRRTR